MSAHIDAIPHSTANLCLVVVEYVRPSIAASRASGTQYLLFELDVENSAIDGASATEVVDRLRVKDEHGFVMVSSR